jgi:hypothetical protein
MSDARVTAIGAISSRPAASTTARSTSSPP